MLAVWMAAAPLTSWAAPGDEVLVIRTSDLAPYRTVESSFQKASGRPLRQVSLSEAGGSERAARELNRPAALVLAIGPEASKLVAGHKPSTPTLYTMVPNPSVLGPAAAARVLPMFADPQAQLKTVRQLLPKAQTLGVVFDPAHSSAIVEAYGRAASEAGFKLVRAQVASRGEVASAVRGMVGRVDALWLVPDATVISVDTVKFLVETSLSNRLPLIGFSQGIAKAGALVAFEAEYSQLGEAAARAARRVIAAGAAETQELPAGVVYLNGRAAELLGISLADAVRGQARRVF